MQTIGKVSTLAFTVGDYWESSKQHQAITLWIDGKNFSEYDNIVYLPTFYTKLKNEIDRIKSGSFYREEFKQLYHADIYRLLEERDVYQFKVLCYDLTTVSANVYLIDNGKNFSLIYSFLDQRHEPASEIGEVYSMAIDKAYFLNVLQQTLDSLSTTWF